MQTQIKILGWFYIILGLLGVLAGVTVFAILLTTGAISGDGEAVLVLSLIGLLAAGFLTIISGPGIITGFGLLKYKSWARVLALILGGLNLLSFPFGTVLGVYTFIVLLNDETSTFFFTHNS